MRLEWYGTAALILREDDTSIAFDPFCGLGAGESLYSQHLSSREREFRNVNIVFATHGHFDHVSRIPVIYKDAKSELWCTRTPYKTMLRKGIRPEQMHLIAPGDTVHAGPFTVTAYQSRHCRFDLPLVARTLRRSGFFRHPVRPLRMLGMGLKYRENKEILLYEVLCKNKRIQIMGSLNLSGNVEYPTGADVLILPFQGRSDLEEYGLSIVRRLKPKKVYLDHYDNSFPPVSDTINTKNFERLLREQEKIPCQALEKGAAVYE